MPELTIRDLSFSYPEGKPRRRALEGLSLRVRDGEFLCVVGPSGSGKSTLLRLLAGLERPEAGTLLLDGREITAPGPDRMIVFQDYALFPWMRVRQNVSFALRAARHCSRREAAEAAEAVLRRVGLGEALELYPFQLSGGMKQRAAIARALAVNGEVLLLDEPFAAVDAKNRAGLQELLLSLWQGGGEKRKTVVFVTHDIREAVLRGDRAVFLRQGRITGELSIPLPRPRREEDLVPYRERLLALFREGEEAAYEE